MIFVSEQQKRKQKIKHQLKKTKKSMTTTKNQVQRQKQLQITTTLKKTHKRIINYNKKQKILDNKQKTMIIIISSRR